MQRPINKWTIRLTATGLFVAALLLVIVLNPGLTYAHKTTHGSYTVFHDEPLAPALVARLDQATALVQASELYTPKLRLDICLNDGSSYPALVQALRGQAFGWGFYNKVVLRGTANAAANWIELNGYKWNLTQLLAHEMTHCLQFERLGFWKSNPVADLPEWKWEGYAEYVARQGNDQKSVARNVARLLNADATTWEINFDDGTMAPRTYYDHWVLVQYCTNIKKMTYGQVLAATVKEPAVRQEMMRWFAKQK